jgi:hypothetical protein
VPAFKDLAIGQKFDFINPAVIYNSFYLRCEKITDRKYRDSNGTVHRVGTVKAQVFHVAPSYPTTLDRVAAEGTRIHVTAETGGMRFYLGGFATYGEAETCVSDTVKRHPGKPVSYYLVDRSGSHFLSGDADDFADHMAKHHHPVVASTL